MSDRMRPVPFRQLVLRSLAEFRAKKSIFDIPAEHFWKPAAPARTRIFTSQAANPVGPAAGPHTQLSQNIIASWLVGGRYIELKTVQKLDELTVEKPCIDAADEGYNVEWSTELTLEQAYDEYLKAWFLVHFLHTLTTGGDPMDPGTLFNMSVGYDMPGITTEKMDRFMNRLMDSGKEPLFARFREELAALAADPRLLKGTPWQDRQPALQKLSDRIPSRLCTSVTLSTMHGCPPGEIESICAYMLEKKGLDTLVKLNPTLLGYEAAREITSAHGYGSVALKPEGFARDLQYADAIPMLKRLLAIGTKQGRHFGAKLSNTLAAANTRGVLPGGEMYMSGRALYPLTIRLASRLADEFDGALPLSFSGGVSAWNIADVLGAGIRPITVATDLLKPGGYARMKELAEIAEGLSDTWNSTRVDAAKVRSAAAAALAAPFLAKDFRGTGKVHVEGALPLFDCFIAPCMHACPIHQDVPEYVHLAGEGRFEEAFSAIYRRNPLPFMTGYLCDHQCTENCTRLDWEGSVRIREVKRIAAEEGYRAFRASGALAAHRAPQRGVKAAVVGAGPAGMAAAAFLAREGFETHMFEREEEAGGIVRYLLPPFRIPQGAVEKDVSLLRDHGVVFHFGQTPPAAAALKAQGYRYVIAGVGAESDRGIGIPGAREVLSFLRQFRRNPGDLRLGRSVVVVGAGDTAMDAARSAKRCPGVAEVRIVYRRGMGEMPATKEEYASAREEGIMFHFLRSPESWDQHSSTLVCTVMELGPADASGRALPVATGATESFPANTVITAVGAEVDPRALERLGLAGGDAAVDPLTQETRVRDVFLVGDAAQGAATIVKAIASARRAVDAVCARENGSRETAWHLPAENTARLRGLRDHLTPASAAAAADRTTRAIEAQRCLGCRALCVKCVEVCPNRANTFVPAGDGFRDAGQIVHLDAFCNECGNCATFCPWEGRPYRDKLTVFAAEEDFRDSTNPGFFLRGRTGMIRTGGQERVLRVDAAGVVTEGTADVPTAALVRAIVKDHTYMLGGTT